MPRITKLTPIQIYRLLPKTNCKACGEESCMAFAIKLLNLQTSIEKCKPLVEDPKYRKNYEELKKLLKPAIREVTIGKGEKSVKIGGEYVMHRHELTFMRKTVIAVTIEDTMKQETIDARLDLDKKFRFEYLDKVLTLDAIAIKYSSGDPERFVKVFEYVRSRINKPLIVVSLHPKVYEKLGDLLKEERPLIYAATRENWHIISDYAKKFECPITVLHEGDPRYLISLANAIRKRGVEDICIDPGAMPSCLGYAVKTATTFRWLACNEDCELVGYPIVTSTVPIWMSNLDYNMKLIMEACLASVLIIRYASLLIMYSPEAVTYLPVTVLRENYYSDPRRPTTIQPGLKEIGKPNELSPVLVTCNYALTYSIVTSDLEKGKVDAYLLVIDTEGYAVDVSVAADKFRPEKIAELIKETGIENKVKHRYLVIPGKAAKLAGSIEEATGWKVIVGPIDSSDLPNFIEKQWKKIIESLQSGSSSQEGSQTGQS